MRGMTMLPRAFRFATAMSLLVLGSPGFAGDPPPASAPATPTAAEWLARLAAKPRGDARRGQALHQSLFCASCHGEAGVAPTLNWPHLAGQREAYTFKSLQDYQQGLRAGGEHAALMASATEGMTPQEMADVAAWYATLPAPKEKDTPRRAELVAGIVPLIRRGDPARLLTPCASCHGARGQGGHQEAAALAGQNPQYFVRTMLDFQRGQRVTDVHRGMRFVATRLTPEEIQALAAYYADLPRK